MTLSIKVHLFVMNSHFICDDIPVSGGALQDVGGTVWQVHIVLCLDEAGGNGQLHKMQGCLQHATLFQIFL